MDAVRRARVDARAGDDVIAVPQSNGERGYSFSDPRKFLPDAGYGRASNDRPFALELSDSGMPTGRIVHRKTRQVLKRQGRQWIGVRP